MVKQKISCIITLLHFCISVSFGKISLEKLQVDYQSNPLGIDVGIPHFSWQMKALDTRRGYFQTAYQIVVTNTQNKIVWDSKKINSSISHGIVYAGTPLEATTRYTWRLTVWNNFDEVVSKTAWFETGLVSTDISAWSGAQWIGGSTDDLVLYAHALSVFKFEYGIQLDKNSNSTKAAFVFGGNDARLMNKDLNLMGVEAQRNKNYIKLELDISGVSDLSDGLAKLNIYRVGYDKTDSEEKAFKSLDIPQTVINQTNKYDKHHILAECNFGLFDFYIDGKNKITEKTNEPPSPFGNNGINLNPVGKGNNYISFPMLADIGFQTNTNQIAYFSDLIIRNYRLPSNPLFTENLTINSYNGVFRSDKLSVVNNQYKIHSGALILADPSRNAAPMLRSTFVTPSKTISRARLYVTARGIYEMHLNGKRIGNDYFNPGLTQYNKHQMYQTYDVTKYIQEGKTNALGAWLSEGWWSGNITYSGENWNFFGDRQSLLCKLEIIYADGTKQTITSNTNDWKLFTEGPIRYGSFFQGEFYDATKEKTIEGWSTAIYDDKNWKRTVEVPLDGTAYIDKNPDPTGRRTPVNYNNLKITGQLGENPGIVMTLTAKSVEEVRPKVFVYDMGQNMVGFPQIKIRNGKKGQLITLRYAEVKYPDLPDYKGNEGMIMMENIRAALTTDTYLLKGGDETIQPRFTFHGYRYLEITGINTAIPIYEVKGMVVSSITGLSSNYSTSNDLVNKLWQNITWSLRSNFLSIPTDTPARNERMGWSGDISVFSRSATYLTDADVFLRRHMLAMRDIQPESGRFTDVAPVGGGFGGTLWGSAGIVVPWETYQQYGDIKILEENYDAMNHYMIFLKTKLNEQGILNEGPLGDWLSPEGNRNDNTLFWMAHYAYDLEIMAKTARLLGKTSEAAEFMVSHNAVKKHFNEVYIDKGSFKTIKSGVKTGFMGPPNERNANQPSDKGQVIDTQASYAIPLALGIFNEANKTYAIGHLNESISRSNKDDSGVDRPPYSLMTGFIGTASIMQALSENNQSATAYRLLQQNSYPSWLYSVVNGATSIWERLNSYTVENGFGGNNSMNSFNHYSFGAVAAWMYNYSLGIQRSPDIAGFKQFVLKPIPDPDKKMKWAKGYYDSVYGRISSEWKTEIGKWTYKTTIPANTTATLYLPANALNKISETGKTLIQNRRINYENGEARIILNSGNYTFEIKD
ncbi:family 78 glycoside hydrolase catalytic domain [Emticicia sp. BO119]|uniref:family 78 glycoside hydrolase catalytic domain n=1 Tax=Emticicia sp. BO119 TaxID=2757768 RepID=UPI0015F06A49|nr:family 78 glycoside hydrolase catalytic domain [Emticicia sp. BO119]MBA4849437.1 family 78 glycoside hydrolase catalytic domain [Emticicia sp. BO119]